MQNSPIDAAANRMDTTIQENSEISAEQNPNQHYNIDTGGLGRIVATTAVEEDGLSSMPKMDDISKEKGYIFVLALFSLVAVCYKRRMRQKAAGRTQ